ncbi:hypothetical protein [Austwickia sp. TVS 96-490-7B]|uniref:hypothetical protein n=1 Tax=Austwickia sp. TVS 96-490-7B TaxID=2830843 RepID=UPI001C59AA0B|nr:hypothetical protein [Austwickia sp. TVS 96-490-7B]
MQETRACIRIVEKPGVADAGSAPTKSPDKDKVTIPIIVLDVRDIETSWMTEMASAILGMSFNAPESIFRQKTAQLKAVPESTN